MEHRVHRRDVGQERLRGTDVRGRLLAPDVLLARLQRHAVSLAAAGIDGNADDPSGRLADERLAGGEEGRMRTAIAERHAETL
jgi:hypothetical protein